VTLYGVSRGQYVNAVAFRCLIIRTTLNVDDAWWLACGQRGSISESRHDGALRRAAVGNEIARPWLYGGYPPGGGGGGGA